MTIAFDSMPNNVIWNVLNQLNQVTGSEGIVNHFDIPVVMRYACHLECTSKQMAAKVNHSHATAIFLQSLSDKYDKPCEHFAALLNTVGARKRLWNYIHENRDNQSYQVIQDIRGLASHILKGELEPNPSYYQTKQGFVLYNDWPRSQLATPFGKITIYNSDLSLDHSSLSMAEVLVKRLNAVFEIVKTVNTDCKSLEIYKLREVKGKKIADVVDYNSEESQRSYETIKRIWEMLEINRSGMNPVVEKKKHKKIVEPSPLIEKPLFKNISEVSQWSIELISKLEQQSFFEGEKWLDMPSKLLVLEDFTKAKMIEILNSGTKKLLDKNRFWPIYTFGCGNNQRSLDGKYLGSGIELWIYEENKPCDLSTLGKAYDSILKKIGQGWVKSKLKDYPDVLTARSEEDYVLFIKKEQSIPEEGSFIVCLARQVGLSRSIVCGSDWKKNSSFGTYMWIEKNKLEKALAILNITS